MALVGDVTLYKLEVVGQKEIIVENDGVKETQMVDVYEEVVDKVIEDAYVMIRMCAFHTDDYDRIAHDENGQEITIDVPRGDTKNPHYLHYRYNIYTSKEDRQDRYFSPLEEIDTIERIQVEDLTLGGQTVFQYCYTHLKQKKGFTELTDN
tara:strand:+ start:866 stop:1318 length:453 start_codon:yes stop_codon:yes gene_type:complete